MIFDVDVDQPEDCLALRILVEGLLRFAPAGTPDDPEKAHLWERLHSGALFSLMACNCFGVFLGAPPLSSRAKRERNTGPR